MTKLNDLYAQLNVSIIDGAFLDTLTKAITLRDQILLTMGKAGIDPTTYQHFGGGHPLLDQLQSLKSVFPSDPQAQLKYSFYLMQLHKRFL